MWECNLPVNVWQVGELSSWTVIYAKEGGLQEIIAKFPDVLTENLGLILVQVCW
jgi:hypothetical protein